MDKHMSTNTYLISPLMILFLITQLYVSNTFIVGTGVGFHKCYYCDVSHDKTLQIRFGYPRTQKQDCTMSLSIDFQHHKQFNDQEIQKKDIQLYNDIFHCASMSPRQLFVYKHTPSQSQYLGSYRICVTSIQDHNQNNNTLFQLIISQKYDPILMADMLQSPLVNSAEIVDLQAIVVQIKRTLSWCQVRIKEAENIGEKLIGGLKEASIVNQNMTYIQILFLIGYGIIWLIVVKQIFGNK